MASQAARCSYISQSGTAYQAYAVKDGSFCYYHDPRPEAVAKRQASLTKGSKRARARAEDRGLAFATGTRPKEFRLAHLEDLNLSKRTFFVRHPKGEGSWASATEIDVIREDMVPYLERFVRERSAYLQEHGIDRSVPMFPNLYRGPDEFYSANAFYLIKHDVELASGVDFKLKDFRSTLTSITVNSDMSLLPAMSAQLRHKTIGQTQKSYYRMEQGAAGKQLKNAWKNGPAIVSRKTVIDSKYEQTGYN